MFLSNHYRRSETSGQEKYHREDDARGGEHGEIRVLHAVHRLLEVHGDLAYLGVGVAGAQKVPGEGVVRVDDALGHDGAQLPVRHVQPDGDLALVHLLGRELGAVAPPCLQPLGEVGSEVQHADRVAGPGHVERLALLLVEDLVRHAVVEVAQEGAGQHPHRAVPHGLAVVVIRATRVRGARLAEHGAVLVAAGQVHGVQLLVDDAQLQPLGVAANGREEHPHLQHREDEDEAECAEVPEDAEEALGQQRLDVALEHVGEGRPRSHRHVVPATVARLSVVVDWELS